MKKLAIILLIILILLNTVACQTRLDAEIASPIIETPDTDPTPEPLPDPVPTPAPAPKPTSIPEPKPEPEPEPEPVRTKSGFIIDDEFSPFEVVVTLTDERTADEITYTVDNFPSLDIFYVHNTKDFYSKTLYPDRVGKQVLILMLNEPSKQNVFDMVLQLENDPSVYCVEPNPIPVTNGINAYLRKEIDLIYTLEEFDESDFQYKGLKKMGIGRNRKCFEFTADISPQNPLDYDAFANFYLLLKDIVNDERIGDIYFYYEYFESSLSLYFSGDEYRREYTLKDFSHPNIKSVETDKLNDGTVLHLNVKLKETNNRTIVNFAKALQDDPRFSSIHFTRLIAYID